MTQHSAGSSNCRRREVHLAGGIAHAAYEVAVGGCDRTLASGKNTHVATQARTARRSGYCAVGVQEDIHQAFLDALTVNLLRCRDDDATNITMNLMTLQHSGGLTHIFDAAVSARADNGLLDNDITSLGCGTRVRGQVRESNCRNDILRVDVVHL